VKRFRGGLVFKAHRLLYHSTLGSRVIQKKKKGLGLRIHVAVKATVDVQFEHASHCSLATALTADWLRKRPPSAPENPAAHTQRALPTADSEFAGHASHSPSPASRLNVPASHAVHVWV